MGSFLEMLSVDGSADAEFDSWTEGLDVGKSCDAVVVDFTLQKCKSRCTRGEDLDEGVFVEEVFCSDFERNST